MTNTNIFLAGVLAFSAFACGEAGDDDGGVAPLPREDECGGAPCAGDTICVEAECEPAFDRDYQVRMSVYVPIRDEQHCADDRLCPLPPLEVYYSELAFPILDAEDPRVAEIEVIEGSSLIVERAGDRCTIDLTAERLRLGTGTCTSGGVSVTLKLSPLPL